MNLAFSACTLFPSGIRRLCFLLDPCRKDAERPAKGDKPPFAGPQKLLCQRIKPFLASFSLKKHSTFCNFKNLDYKKEVMKISSPMPMRMTPPRMEALPAKTVPNLRPMSRPTVQMTKVTAAMMAAQTNAWTRP